MMAYKSQEYKTIGQLFKSDLPPHVIEETFRACREAKRKCKEFDPKEIKKSTDYKKDVEHYGMYCANKCIKKYLQSLDKKDGSYEQLEKKVL